MQPDHLLVVPMHVFVCQALAVRLTVHEASHIGYVAERELASLWDLTMVRQYTTRRKDCTKCVQCPFAFALNTFPPADVCLHS